MRRKLWIVLVVSAGLAAPLAQAARLYKWVDEHGNVSYQDRPPPAGSGSVEEKDVRVGPRYGRPSSADEADPASKHPVVLYSVPKCTVCDLARAYLNKRNVPFTEKNVATDVALQQEMKEKVGDLTVPTITVGRKVMKGYIESLLEGELDEAGYPKIAEPPPAQ